MNLRNTTRKQVRIIEVIKISPRGYCYGVVDAMVLARQAAQNLDLPRPIYILGMIVHNSHVTQSLRMRASLRWTVRTGWKY